MKLIEKLSDMIDEELDDAYRYAECSILHEDDAELSKTFKTLANEELMHAMKLHDQVTRIIKDYRETNGEPPKEMLTLYDYLHKRQIEKYSDVKVLLS